MIACVMQPYAICSVKLTPERLVVLNEKTLCIFVLQSLLLLRTMTRTPEIPLQPRGFLSAACPAAAAAAVAAAASYAADDEYDARTTAKAAAIAQQEILLPAAADGIAHAAAAAADAAHAVLAVGWSRMHSYLALPAGRESVIVAPAAAAAAAATAAAVAAAAAAVAAVAAILVYAFIS